MFIRPKDELALEKMEGKKRMYDRKSQGSDRRDAGHFVLAGLYILRPSLVLEGCEDGHDG